MNGQHEARWAELDSRLGHVVADLSTDLRASDAEMIRELLDHNEFGVAFEWLRDALIENSTRVPPDTVAELVELARLMGLDARDTELRVDIANPS